MRTVTDVYKVYTFDELSEEAQKKVLEEFAQFNQECFDTDSLTDAFAEKLKEWGFPHERKQIEWSLGYCQGDGVAFYGEIDVRQYIMKTKQTKLLNLLSPHRNLSFDAARITRNSYGHRYSHWNTMNVELEVAHDERELTPMEQQWVTLLEEGLKEHVVQVSRELENQGYAALENVTTREYIVEQVEINDHEFREDGKLHTGA